MMMILPVNIVCSGMISNWRNDDVNGNYIPLLNEKHWLVCVCVCDKFCTPSPVMKGKNLFLVKRNLLPKITACNSIAFLAIKA